MLQQSLELNTSNFKIGDTLIGQLFYKAIFVVDSAYNVIDTNVISVKFRLPIRGKFFDNDSLKLEKNIQYLPVSLSSKQPDTVTKLGIPNCGLTELPIELKKFKNLTRLEIYDNNLENADLSMLCNFKKLKALKLENCNLTEIPASIFCLKSLEELSLFDNNINALPKQLFVLTNIKSLELGGNLLTSLPNEILKLKNLELLNISGYNRNNIEHLPLNFFKELKKIKEFYPPDFMREIEYKDFKNVKN